MIFIMEPRKIRAKLILKGITLTDIARMEKSYRQQVWYAIHSPSVRSGTKAARILKRIDDILKG
jgi:hypothetical protein